MNFSISPTFPFFFSPQPSSQTWVRDLPFALPLPTPPQRITIMLFFVHSSYESLATCSSPLLLFVRSPGRSTWLLESMCLRASFFYHHASRLAFSHFPCLSPFFFCCLCLFLCSLLSIFPSRSIALCCFTREFLIPQHFSETLRLPWPLQLQSSPSYELKPVVPTALPLYPISNACFISSRPQFESALRPYPGTSHHIYLFASWLFVFMW